MSLRATLGPGRSPGLSPSIFDAQHSSGRTWPCIVGVDHPGESMWFADARAPLRLLEPTVAIWRALRESAVGVAGSCVEAAYVLGLRLELCRWSPTFVSCTWRGWPHLYVRVDNWALDPTTEQFGGGGPLVFQIGSSDDDYVAEPGGGETLCEAGIGSKLAFRLARDLP